MIWSALYCLIQPVQVRAADVRLRLPPQADRESARCWFNLMAGYPQAHRWPTPPPCARCHEVFLSDSLDKVSRSFMQVALIPFCDNYCVNEHP